MSVTMVQWITAVLAAQCQEAADADWLDHLQGAAITGVSTSACAHRAGSLTAAPYIPCDCWKGGRPAQQTNDSKALVNAQETKAEQNTEARGQNRKDALTFTP